VDPRDSIIRKSVDRAMGLVVSRRKGWWRVLANQAAAVSRQPYVPCLPVHVSIEPTNACDMGCPVCETGAGTMERPTGRMTLENFRRIVDKIHTHTNTIFFYFMGEPFLYKESYEMIAYAKSKRIFVDTCTNGHFVNAKALLDSGLDQISFQIGGTTQATHQIYRVGGRLQTSLDNMQAVIEERNRRGVAYPKVIMGFILMKHNEHQVSDFLELGRRLGVDEANVIDPCVRNMEQAKQFLPTDERYWFYDKGAFNLGQLRPKLLPDNQCWWIWHSTLVTWNGDVVPCCRDPQGKHVMGNLLEQDLSEIWNGRKYKEFRRRILTDQGKIDICRLCSSYGVPILEPTDIRIVKTPLAS
jgi:radical SAM protein with 4Fe4S-binding SPASM domain